MPILVDLNKNEIFIYEDNVFYNNWNTKDNNDDLLNYQLINEDIDDLNIILKNYGNLEKYNFEDILKKYDNQDFIIPIIYKEDSFIRILSKINLENNTSTIKSDFIDTNISLIEDTKKIISNLKLDYENSWKKINQINKFIKLPLTISLDSKNYQLINNFENELKSSELVNKFNIYKIDNKNIIYKVIYNSTPDKFIKSFKNKNFQIDISNEIWKLYE